MKKTLHNFSYKAVSLIVFSFLFFNSTFAQIQNGDFESWNSNGPVGWLTPGNSPQNGIQLITKSTNAFHGSYAVKGEVVGKDINGQKLVFPPSISGIFPFTEKPREITMYSVFKPVGGDVMSVSVMLNKGKKLEEIGVGYNISGYQHATDINGYVRHVMPFRCADSTSKPSFTCSDSTLPDSIEIYISISGPNGGLPHEGSVFYIDDISALSLTRPGPDSLIVSGEKYTIKWTYGSTNTKNINLYYSLNKGGNYTSIVNNYPADSENYVWKVPLKLISRKSKIKVESATDTSNYDTVSCRIKPWELTRLDANGNYVPFRPDKDGWQFKNDTPYAWSYSSWKNIDYQNGIDPNTNKKYPDHKPFKKAKGSRFPTWNIWVETFGVDKCYSVSGNNKAYKYRAANLWYSNSQPSWKGDCYGFAVSSLLYFYHKTGILGRFSNIGDYPRLISAPVSNYAQNAIGVYFTYQFSKHVQSDIGYKIEHIDAQKLLAHLKSMFELDNGDAKPLTFENAKYGHEVVAYKLERINGSHKFNLKLYDNDFPKINDRSLMIDSSSDKWTDTVWAGTNTFRCFLGSNSSFYLNTPIMAPQKISNTPITGNLILSPSNSLTIYTADTNDIKITSNLGKSISYSKSIFENNIYNAFPIIPKTGSFNPPIGYVLPDGKYSVKINKFTDPSQYVNFVDDTLIYVYRRENAGSNQSDLLYYNHGVSLSNPDTSLKKIDLETIIDLNNKEKVFDVNNFKFPGGDSIQIRQKDFSNLFIQNFGKTENYNLQIINVSGGEEVDFVHDAVNLSSNSSQLIKPSWGNLDSNKVKILIDNGNNGTYDDSIVVTNQVTQVKGMFSSKVPSRFKLFQNYPNPFNPTTTIKYEIPKSEFVTIKVYNVLGQLVSTLVNAKKTAGSFSVQFNGSGLSSGVYFYVLKAGSFTGAKKFVLMK